MEVICDLKKTAHGIAISVTSNYGVSKQGKNQAHANVLARVHGWLTTVRG